MDDDDDYNEDFENESDSASQQQSEADAVSAQDDNGFGDTDTLLAKRGVSHPTQIKAQERSAAKKEDDQSSNVGKRKNQRKGRAGKRGIPGVSNESIDRLRKQFEDEARKKVW